MQEKPNDEYISTLKGKSKSLNRTVAYRATAELEDIDDGHWDGPRTDDPPESWWHSPIPEPVPKDIQAKFVQAEQDLMWLAEHGMLDITARFLTAMRHLNESEERLDAWSPKAEGPKVEDQKEEVPE